jgi:hypothetical protein
MLAFRSSTRSCRRKAWKPKIAPAVTADASTAVAANLVWFEFAARSRREAMSASLDGVAGGVTGPCEVASGRLGGGEEECETYSGGLPQV